MVVMVVFVHLICCSYFTYISRTGYHYGLFSVFFFILFGFSFQVLFPGV